MSQRIAIIDLGSNSVRLIIVEIFESSAYNLIYHQKETARLSQDADQDKLLKPYAIERVIAVLKNFAQMCKLHNTDKILAVGTAAIRNSLNGAEFIRMARQETGINIKIINGETEARLGYIGAINTLDVNDALLFDLGGGSTELTLIRNRKAENFISLPFGAVTLTERFKLQTKASESQLAKLDAFLREQLEQIPWLKDYGFPLIGIGGTARGIGKMEQKRNNYPLMKLHNYRTSSISFNLLWNELRKMTAVQRRKIPGLSNDRADIIIAGLAIVKNLFSKAASEQLIISSCGVREGLFLQYYLTLQGQAETTVEPLKHSLHNTLLAYYNNPKHAYHVAQLADNLFSSWQDKLELSDSDRRLLHVAAVLHDIGIGINYYDHPRHSAYLIENARLFGLSHREQVTAALIAGWHHTPSAKHSQNKLYSEFLDAANWQAARKLGLLLALAESLDISKLQLISQVSTIFDDKQATLRFKSRQLPHLEILALKKHSKWFKKETGLELAIDETPL